MEVVNMHMTNSTVEIKDGKVLFSKEILEYFENLRNKETSEWIDKYFEVLSDTLNFDAEKYNIHHIRPCFTFKDSEHTKREESKPLADKFEGNLIKLSIYNHIKAHYFLWKIFDNFDSRNAIQQMCGIKIYIESLSENELSNIAEFQEECAEENQTKEEKDEYNKKWRTEHKEELKIYQKKHREENIEKITKRKKQRYQENRDKILEEKRKYHQENKEKISKDKKKYYDENRDEILEKKKREYNQDCYDPIKEEPCVFGVLKGRKQRHPDLYKDVIPRNCIIKEDQQ